MDKIWGIGLAAQNPKALNKGTWRGKNWLGYILTNIRNDLMKEEPTQETGDGISNSTQSLPENYLKKADEAEGTSQDSEGGRKEKYEFFFGIDSPFSNFHPAKFTVDGVEYNCTEQYMMHQKAGMMHTLSTDQLILGFKINKFG